MSTAALEHRVTDRLKLQTSSVYGEIYPVPFRIDRAVRIRGPLSYCIQGEADPVIVKPALVPQELIYYVRYVVRGFEDCGRW